jgi:phosphatidylglycerol lysyltransferase
MPNLFGSKLLSQIGTLLSMTIVCVALWLMFDMLHSFSLSDIIRNLEKLSPSWVLLGFVITTASYLTVTGYDVVALRHIKRKVPYPRAALSAFLASTFGNNIGFSILTGTSIRYRIYTGSGLSALDIAGVSSMCALTTVLGMSCLFSLSMVLQIGNHPTTIGPLPAVVMQAAGILILLLISSYVILSAYNPLTLKSTTWSLKMPSAGTTLAQILLATTNLSLVATLLYVLLPTATDVSYTEFLGVFSLAIIAGSASNIPGGIGVFETVVLVGLPEISPPALLGSILLFRCIYYLTPLAVAAMLLTYHETQRQKHHIEELQESVLDVLDEIGPQIMTLIVMLAGAMLLFSGSIPVGFDRDLLPLKIPLFLVELAHLSGAAVGVGLLISARGISRRLGSAFRLAYKLLLVGILTSLLKGFGYREAILLGLILGLLWYTRSEFHRKSAVLEAGIPFKWAYLLSIVLAITVWLGLFSFKDIPYSDSLWWSFSYDNDFSRFLRSLLLIVGTCTIVAHLNGSKPSPLPGPPESVVLSRIRKILDRGSGLMANLVLLGDKRILFSPTGNAFIMYQIQNKSWVVLGDPVGPEEEHRELIWAFYELCSRYGAWPVFYMVNENQLAFFNKLDFSIEKMGNEAIMPLQDFSLDSVIRTELLVVRKRAISLGASVEIMEGQALDHLIPELKSVSDNWLEAGKIDEMGFSRGFFDHYYIRNFPCAIVRIDGQIVAFAVIWTTAAHDEMGLDLMRFHVEAPTLITDYLIIETMLWGKKTGFRRCNLGIAPLPGFKNYPLPPLWYRVSVLMYHSGQTSTRESEAQEMQNRLTWKPRYILWPATVEMPRIIQNINRLISQKNVRARTSAPCMD